MFDNLAGLPDPDALKQYVYFVTERENIRRAKEAGIPAPWTFDPILQTYKFCNMRRVDDRVSRWLVQNLYTPYAGSPLLWFMPVVARWVNWPPTLAVGLERGAWNAAELDEAWFRALGTEIDNRVRAGEKAWTGAYMVTARRIPAGLSKGEWLALSTFRPIWEQRERFQQFFEQPTELRTVEDALGLFKGAYNFGTFMAGQIVADWTYTALLDRAPDLKTYAPIGPGSTRGLNRLFGRALEKPIRQAQFNDELQLALQNLDTAVDTDAFTLHDVQNTFCEFDKYSRAMNGGRPRANYQPETRF